MDANIHSVELDKVYRLLNHGPTVLVSSSFAGTDDVMAAAWACALDFSPPKVTVVIDKIAATRKLVEDSGYFALQIPNVDQINATYALGTTSLGDTPDKVERSGAKLFRIEGFDTPLVEGCSGWLICKVIPEPHNQANYDLFIGEVVAAWADVRIFEHGHWKFEASEPRWRSLHYVAGGHFYAIGEQIAVTDSNQ